MCQGFAHYSQDLVQSPLLLWAQATVPALQYTKQHAQVCEVTWEPSGRLQHTVFFPHGRR